MKKAVQSYAAVADLSWLVGAHVVQYHWGMCGLRTRLSIPSKHTLLACRTWICKEICWLLVDLLTREFFISLLLYNRFLSIHALETGNRNSDKTEKVIFTSLARKRPLCSSKTVSKIGLCHGEKRILYNLLKTVILIQNALLNFDSFKVKLHKVKGSAKLWMCGS